MTNHEVSIAGGTGAWQAKCKCRRQSRVCFSRTAADDWKIAHLAEVERIKSLLGNRSPGLKDQRDWYAKMEQDPDITEYDRGLWRQLREELDRRLGPAETQEETLF